MSFAFKWPTFSEQFHADAVQLLNSALNKGNKPPVIADRIHVVDLQMGTQPPELEIRDIGDLSLNQFRGIFRLTYSGDAHVVLKTKVQVNPLHHKKPDKHFMGGSRGMLAANQPLIVPMLLRLSNFKLDSYVVLVVSKQKGITLVFKTDPLQNVDINSTFDSISIVQTFIQMEIEDQLRRMFREDLPSIIHRLSQRWVIATAYGSPVLNRHMISQDRNRDRDRNTMSTSHKPYVAHPQVSLSLLQCRQSFDSGKTFSKRYFTPKTFVELKRQDTLTHSSEPSSPLLTTSCNTIDGAIEPFSSKADGNDYISSRRHFKTDTGLTVLAEEPNKDEDDWVDYTTLGSSEQEDSQSGIIRSSIMLNGANMEYETLPAVGGGTVIRPRIYHSSSLLYDVSGSHSILSNTSSMLSFSKNADSSVSSHFSSQICQNSSLAYSSAPSLTTNSYAEPSMDQTLHVSLDTHAILSNTVTACSSGVDQSIYTPPSLPINHLSGVGRFKHSSRKTSFSSVSQWTDQSFQFDPESEIVVRPALNNTVSQLSSLNFANHTLSPFTRNLEHFTIRSVPPKRALPAGYQSPSDKQLVKARRKGTHHLCSKKETKIDENKVQLTAALTPFCPGFEPSEIDQYFRAHDDYIPLQFQIKQM